MSNNSKRAQTRHDEFLLGGGSGTTPIMSFVVEIFRSHGLSRPFAFAAPWGDDSHDLGGGFLVGVVKFRRNEFRGPKGCCLECGPCLVPCGLRGSGLSSVR